MNTWPSVEYGPFRTERGLARVRVDGIGVHLTPHVTPSRGRRAVVFVLASSPLVLTVAGVVFIQMDRPAVGDPLLVLAFVAWVLVSAWALAILLRSLVGKRRQARPDGVRERRAPESIPVADIQAVSEVAGTFFPAFTMITTRGALTLRAPIWRAGELRIMHTAARASVPYDVRPTAGGDGPPPSPGHRSL